MTGSPAFYLSAGEPSGDLHGAQVAAALRRLCPDAVIEGMGGPRMAEAGVELVELAENYGAMGLFEAAASLPAHVALLSRVRRRLSSRRYKVLILIDYPGFNLRLAAHAARRGVRVVYYIAPQLWAWGPGRAAELRRSGATVAAILPFEADFFRDLGINARFVGHPLLDRTSSYPRHAARMRLGLPEDCQVLALLPGSRPEEVRRLWPLLRDAAIRYRTAHPQVRVIVAAVPGQSYPASAGFCLCWNDAPLALSAADAALCKSGTATLQAALTDTPHALVYAMHPLTFQVARRVVRVPYVSLVNLIAGRRVTPEYVQSQATLERLVEAVSSMLEAGSSESDSQRAGLAEVRRRLGAPGAAERVARLALERAA